MFMSSARLLRGIASGGALIAAIAFSPAAGPASADPISAAIATTNCSYAQVTAALNAQAPDLANQLNSRPQMQARLQQFLAMPIDQREQMIAQQQATNPMMEQMIAQKIGPQGEQELIQVASTCVKY